MSLRLLVIINFSVIDPVTNVQFCHTQNECLHFIYNAKVCKYVAVIDLILFLFEDNLRRIQAVTKFNQIWSKSETMNRVSKKKSQELKYFCVLELKSLTILTIFLSFIKQVIIVLFKLYIYKHYGTFDNSQAFQSQSLLY